MEFSDFLIMPRTSEINSRADVDLTTEITCPHSNQQFKSVPLIVSNMYNCGTVNMANVLNKYGVSIALHKFYNTEQLKYLFDAGCFERNWLTIGLRERDINFDEIGKPKLICLDVANGYIRNFIDFVKEIRGKLPDSIIMAGNVCTEEGAKNLFEAGASIIKVGIGPGKLCRSRNVTGVGVPQGIAVENCASVAKDYKGYICSDGGIKEIGDFAKAFALGANFVMAGSIFMGFEENEGDWTYIQKGWSDKDTNNTIMKNRLKVYGMSSLEAMQTHYGKKDSYRASEGACEYIDYKGPVEPFIQEVLGGLRSTCTYVNRHLRDLSEVDIVCI